jgi:hypothetical protein
MKQETGVIENCLADRFLVVRVPSGLVTVNSDSVVVSGFSKGQSVTVTMIKGEIEGIWRGVRVEAA